MGPARGDAARRSRRGDPRSPGPDRRTPRHNGMRRPRRRALRRLEQAVVVRTLTRPHRPVTPDRRSSRPGGEPMSRSRHPRPPRSMLAAWLLALVGALAALRSLGADHPGSPPVTEPGRWAGWWSARDPVDAAAGIARLLAMGSIIYLLLLTTAMLSAAVVARRSERWTTRRRAR